MSESKASSSPSIVTIGNPGAGKSTILNAIAGKQLFKSGVSIGSGLTFQLDRKTDNGNVYVDTPGISDNEHREKAGKDISVMLKEGGVYKMLIFVKESHGRVITEDITTMKLVLDAAPEIGNKFGIIVNQVGKKVMKRFQDNENVAKFIISLFHGTEKKFHHENILFLPANDILDGEENRLVTLDELPNLYFFLEYVPDVRLTTGRATDIKTGDFDKMANEISELRRTMEKDRLNYNNKIREMMIELEKSSGFFGKIGKKLSELTGI